MALKSEVAGSKPEVQESLNHTNIEEQRKIEFLRRAPCKYVIVILLFRVIIEVSFKQS